MGRSKRDGRLEYPTPRLKLLPRKEPYWTGLEEGQSLGYYRPKNRAAGRWLAKFFDVETKKRSMTTLGTADDYTEADGQQVLNYAQAQEKAREWIQAARTLITGEESRKGPYTVAYAMEDYQKDCIRRGVKSGEQMGSVVRAHILPTLGNLEVARLTRSRLERWHEALASQPARVRTKKTASEPAVKAAPTTEEGKRQRRATANRVLSVLKAALNLALHRKRTACSGEAWRELKPFRGATQARTRFLSIEEQGALVGACDPEFKLVVQAALLTGARYGEITRMVVRDYDETSGTVHIPVAKGGKPRHVFLTEEGKEFFRKMTGGRKADEVLFQRTSYPTRNGARKDIPILRHWKASEQFREMSEACKRASIEPLNFHQLRHSYASTLVNAGIPLAYIAQQLGHTGTRMVEKHYGHLAPNAVAESIRKLAPSLGLYLPAENVVPFKAAT
ncbi:phage-related integrase [Geothrix oryzae]|uniref:Phage-related integrase n=1 Tax=Geothrix oryzae TaxID=2927975 RepID=A0ABN6V036_9BACT|nr:phage-related integrase [Geothrix oryzae]